jgi:hypothetical protein
MNISELVGARRAVPIKNHQKSHRFKISLRILWYNQSNYNKYQGENNIMCKKKCCCGLCGLFKKCRKKSKGKNGERIRLLKRSAHKSGRHVANLQEELQYAFDKNFSEDTPYRKRELQQSYLIKITTSDDSYEKFLTYQNENNMDLDFQKIQTDLYFKFNEALGLLKQLDPNNEIFNTKDTNHDISTNFGIQNQ